MSLYFTVLLSSFLIPFIFSFHNKINFNKFFFPVFLTLTSTSIFFIIWDIYFTSIQVWGFTNEYHSSFVITNLPIEEILFFFIIPFCCLFTYFVFAKYSIFNFKVSVNFLILICIALALLAILYYDKTYTMSVISLSILILIHIIFSKPKWIGYFFSMYFVISLIPFLIVNGVLTGFITEQPPVWYNDNSIIGYKLLTIPVEDFLYNFILLYSNVLLFEYYKKRIKISL